MGEMGEMWDSMDDLGEMSVADLFGMRPPVQIDLTKWTTAEGITLPITAIDDDHLGKIVAMLRRQAGTMEDAIRASAERIVANPGDVADEVGVIAGVSRQLDSRLKRIAAMLQEQQRRVDKRNSPDNARYEWLMGRSANAPAFDPFKDDPAEDN